MKGSCAVAILGFLSFPAVAGQASDTVRRIYVPELADVTAPGYRGHVAEPALTVLAKDDVLSDNGAEIGCIDWDPAIDAQDFEQAAVSRTLRLSERTAGDTAQVTARFRLFEGAAGEDRQVLWTLKKAGGEWKIADIESLGGWKLSRLNCGAR